MKSAPLAYHLRSKHRWSSQDLIALVAKFIRVGTWRSVKDLQRVTGLTNSQVRRGVRLYRSTSDNTKWPLVSSREGYKFTEDEDEVYAFERLRARTARTFMQLTWTGAMEPWLIRMGFPPRQIALVHRQWTRLMEDIEALMPV